MVLTRGQRRTIRRRIRRHYRRARKRMYRRYGTSGMSGKHHVKLRLVSAAVSNGSGVVTGYNSLRNPGLAQDFTNFASLYDFYRVNAVKLKWIPSDPNFDPNVQAAFTNNPYAPMYIITDQDDYDLTNLTTVNIFIQYDNCVIKDFSKPFSVYRSVPTITTATRVGGAAGQANIMDGGFIDINTLVDNGVIAWVTGGTNYTTKTYGQWILTYYITFCNRR